MFRSLRWICVGALLLTCGTPPITMTLSSSATDCKADGSSSVTIDALILRGDAPLDRGKVTFVSALPGSSFAPIPMGRFAFFYWLFSCSSFPNSFHPPPGSSWDLMRE